MYMRRLSGKLVIMLFLLLGTVSCSVTKFVPDNSYLLDWVEIVSQEDGEKNWSQLSKYSYQTPNTRWLGVARVPLGVYSMASRRHPDAPVSSLLRKIGQEPVVLDELSAMASAKDMGMALVNQGYLNARVTSQSQSLGHRRAKLVYTVNAGRLFVVDDIRTVVGDSDFEKLLNDNRQSSLLEVGMQLNSQVLDQERTRIVELAHRNGYYDFNKDHVSFIADTLKGSDKVGLTMMIDGQGTGHVYSVSKVNYLLSSGADRVEALIDDANRLDFDGYSIYWPKTEKELALRPGVIASHSYMRQGQMYNADTISASYQSLSRLGLLKYSNISLQRDPDFRDGIIANVSMMTRPKHSFQFDVEGTNTAGDLGAAASTSFVDRNLFGGAEQLSVTLRGAYESISNLPGYTGDTYLEYGIESSLSFPEFLIPFMNQERQRLSQASSQFSLKANAQRRPEFQKTIFSAGWSYVWGDTWNNSHRLDVIDLNYLVVPWISPHFQKEYLDQITSSKSILKYNYENLLITKLGYSFYRTNSQSSQRARQAFQYSVRAAVETSGNVLSLLSPALGLEKNDNGQSLVMGIAFAQYAKHDFSFTANWAAGSNSSFLAHAEWGLAIPYGNSTSLPFEKRYFAGGANGVRGWAVRELGPGVFGGTDRTIDYIRQSGDIKLGASLEFRNKLFWKLNGAVFVDAGNIWTIREYAEQPGGVFKFDEFYRQIAVAYGLGIRLDFNFLVVRLDGGMKAVNPAGATQGDRIPLTHPDMGRDFAFHLAVGYPF